MPKLNRSDLTLAGLGVIGLLAIFTLYKSAFPLSIVDLEISRDDAIAAAIQRVDDLGGEISEFKQAALFSGETEALIFLQKNLPEDEAARWAARETPIWAWSVRWFKPLETEEWLVDVGVNGAIVGFRHIVEETAAGADLDQDAARRIAEAYVGRGGGLGSLEEISAVTDAKANRTDHLFIWRDTTETIPWDGDGHGESRVSVRIMGDEVAGYARWLHVPEDFSRELENTLSVGTLLAVGSIVITVLLTLAAAVIAIARYKAGDIDWRTAITCGVLVGTMFGISIATNWPQALFSYQTQISWTVFVGSAFLGMILLSVFYVVFVTFPTAAGHSMSREFFPETVRGLADAARGRVFTAEFGRAALRGYAFAAFFLGFLTFFYWLSRNYLGAWMPAEGPYSSIFNNAYPFLTPLTISLVAAISEETIYRLFGISLFRKLTGSTWAALLIPAVIWAFGHSNYPVFPVYVRGIELTIGGLIFGWAFLRYGLVTCIVAHYVVDAVALGMPLVTSANATYIVWGLIAIGLALVPGVIGLFAGGRTDTSAPEASPAEA
jgi:hypothetical protein